MARDQAAGLVNSCRGRVLACTFLDPGKILLCRILEQYLSGVVSKQIMRGLFLGGSGSGLPYQSKRFRPLSWHMLVNTITAKNLQNHDNSEG